MAIKKTCYEDGGVEYEISGILTDKVLSELNKELYQDEEQIKQISYQILNVSNIEGIEVTVNRSYETLKKTRGHLALIQKCGSLFWSTQIWHLGLAGCGRRIHTICLPIMTIAAFFETEMSLLNGSNLKQRTPNMSLE